MHAFRLEIQQVDCSGKISFGEHCYLKNPRFAHIAFGHLYFAFNNS